MRRLIRRKRRGLQRLARRSLRSGELWGGGWSLFCLGHELWRQLPPFRRVRVRMEHPTRLVLPVLSFRFSVLNHHHPTRPFPPLYLTLTLRFRAVSTNCKPWLRGK